MDAHPVLSIVIPAFNYGRYLPKAISSVLEQGVRDLEVVVVDDGSTDDTPTRMGPFLEDSRVRYVRNERNLGAVANINKAFGLARGTFVLLLGADDFLLPGSLAKLHEALLRYPEAGFAYGAYVIADSADRIVRTTRNIGHLPFDLPPGRDDFPDLLQFDDYMNLGTTLFRRSVLAEHGAFDPSLTIDPTPGRFFRATDWDLVLRLALRHVRSVFIYAPMSAFRVHDEQASTGVTFDEEGIGSRESTVLFDRYLTAENRARLAGHEQGLLKMVAYKRKQYLDTSVPGKNGDPPAVLAAFDRAEAYLRDLSGSAQDGAIDPPLLSVVVVVNDDVETMVGSLDLLRDQTSRHWEVVLVNRGRMDLRALCQSLLPGQPSRYLQAPGANVAQARTFGARVATGGALYFHEPHIRLDPALFAAISEALAQERNVAVQVPVETHEPAEAAAFGPSWHQLLGMVLPPGHAWLRHLPPIAGFAMRRHVFFRMRGFDPSPPLLTDLAFLLLLDRKVEIHRLEGPAPSRVPSFVASLFRQIAELDDEGAIDRSLQFIVKRFARA